MLKSLMSMVISCVVGLSLAVWLPALQAASSKSSPAKTTTKAAATKNSSANKKRASTKTKAKSSAKKTSKPKKAAAAKSSSSSSSNCRTVRVKSGKAYKNRRVCSKADPVLQSPISSNALNQGIAPPLAETQLKARTAPDRAYAVDGSTFFHQGRKFRVQGLSADDAGNELARQRLQNALDAGNLDVNPQTIDEAGITTAVVRSGTRDLADILR